MYLYKPMGIFFLTVKYMIDYLCEIMKNTFVIFVFNPEQRITK